MEKTNRVIYETNALLPANSLIRLELSTYSWYSESLKQINHIRDAINIYFS